jgi:hypothetical protein
MIKQNQITIKTYNSDPTLDFNKIQADLYNEAVKPYSNNMVKAEDLKKRFETDNYDKKGMLYAFSEINEPLAYITYHFYPNLNEIYIGCPWGTSNCSEEVKEKLFSDLKTYIKEKFPERKYAYMGYADDKIKPFHDFAKKNGFKKDNWFLNYAIDVESFKQVNFEDFTSKEITLKDIDLLIELSKRDSSLSKQMKEEQLRNYFINKVFKDGNAVMLFKDKAIGATAALRNYNNGLTLARFQAIDQEFIDKTYLVYFALGKLLSEKGLTDERIVITPDKDDSKLIDKLEENGAELISSSSRYKVNL